MTTNLSLIVPAEQTHDERVGERIMTLMFRSRMTQTALGNMIGMSQSALARKLRGERKWTLDDLFAASAAFGVSISTLLGDNESPQPGGPVGGLGASVVGPAGIEPTTSTV
ncbi:XRE family transcriptional regulator [Pseudoclavibacter sp. RFBG4]|uniref:helix-turn-helix domain-containing protein n=1 Tax=Pseudoclavibacter sp. RFBG4 TaxID=2080575 RepID=UPI000CE8AEC9|nr:XRE family transcriptional regulator [Pseudoclavibacter sp. RFBG4]